MCSHLDQHTSSVNTVTNYKIIVKVFFYQNFSTSGARVWLAPTLWRAPIKIPKIKKKLFHHTIDMSIGAKLDIYELVDFAPFLFCFVFC